MISNQSTAGEGSRIAAWWGGRKPRPEPGGGPGGAGAPGVGTAGRGGQPPPPQILLLGELGLCRVAVRLGQLQEALALALVLALAGVVGRRAGRGSLAGIDSLAIDLRLLGVRDRRGDGCEQQGGGSGDGGAGDVGLHDSIPLNE